MQINDGEVSPERWLTDIIAELVPTGVISSIRKDKKKWDNIPPFWSCVLSLCLLWKTAAFFSS